MTMTVQAVFENGVLRPLIPLGLSDGQQVQVLVATESEIGAESLQETLSEEEFEAALDELSAGLDDLPPLPASAISREGIYEGL
jgi:predicted DNA-binding antitoxin AbrB/MazE fold protein